MQVTGIDIHIQVRSLWFRAGQVRTGLHLQRMIRKRIEHCQGKQAIKLLGRRFCIEERIVALPSARGKCRISHHYANSTKFSIPIMVRGIVSESIVGTAILHAGGNLYRDVIYAANDPAPGERRHLLEGQVSAGWSDRLFREHLEPAWIDG